jgi:hypothetical protein
VNARQSRFLIGLFVLCHLTLGLVYAPLRTMRAVRDDEVLAQPDSIALGAIVTQPPLVALAAVLAPYGFLVRFQRSLQLATAAASAVAAGTAFSSPERETGLVLMAFALWLGVFAITQIAISPLRFWLGWRAERRGRHLVSSAGRQFSTWKMLCLTTFVASTAAVLRWLAGPRAFGRVASSEILESLVGGVTVAVLTLFVTGTTWLVLSPQRHWLLRLCLAVFSLCGLIAFGLLWLAPGVLLDEYGDPVFCSTVFGAVASAAATATVLRMAGWQLGRRVGPPAIATEPVDEVGWAPGRYGVAIAPLLGALAASVFLGVQRFHEWRAVAIQAHWRDLGWRAELQDGRLVRLDCLDRLHGTGGTVPAPAPPKAQFEPLLGLNDVTFVSLEAVKLDSRHIALLSHLPSLEGLRLEGADLIEAGCDDWRKMTGLKRLYMDGATVDDGLLKSLAGLPGLEEIWLDMTDVTVEGAKALAGCRRLKFLQLQRTRISRGEAAVLADSMPGVNILAFSDDPQLVAVPLPAVRLSYLRAAGRDMVSFMERVSRTRWLQASGPMGTDELFDQLAGHIYLESLDVRGSQVSDGIIPAAKTLIGLKELDVRGTRLTDAGLAEIRRLLPGCRIVH